MPCYLQKTASGSGSTLSTMLLVVFVVLKLTGNIGWPWWIVLAPFWIPVGVWLFALLVLELVMHLRTRAVLRRQLKE